MLVVLLPLGCGRNNSVMSEEINFDFFAPGEVIIGLYDSTSFHESCDLIIYDLNLFIDHIY
jgi:hypothetical protein